jgi:hypothetical protein
MFLTASSMGSIMKEEPAVLVAGIYVPNAGMPVTQDSFEVLTDLEPGTMVHMVITGDHRAVTVLESRGYLDFLSGPDVTRADLEAAFGLIEPEAQSIYVRPPVKVADPAGRWVARYGGVRGLVARHSQEFALLKGALLQAYDEWEAAGRPTHEPGGEGFLSFSG